LINGNLDKFNLEQVDFVYQYAADLIHKFRYQDVFSKAGIAMDAQMVEPNKLFMDHFNTRNHMESIKNLEQDEEITSIYINYPALLLRKKTEMYPNGRTSHRFKNQLRRRVTIIDKNQNFVD
jgi:hypothetical protein